jgi:hypothetical protein
MGLFFRRQVPANNAVVGAVREALARTVPPERIDAVAGEIAAGATPPAGEVKPKNVPLVVGIGFVVVLLVVAWFLAGVVDPLLIAEAQKQATTQGYQAPELQQKLLSDAIRNVLVAAAGALSGLILGDAVGTATGGSTS